MKTPPPAKKGKKTANKEKRAPGRPTAYTVDLGLSICSRIAEGETMTKICKDDDFPDRSTVWRWTEEHQEFRNSLARARELQAWSWADEAIDIADGAGAKAKGRAGTGEAGAKVQAEKLRIDARKWFVAKLNPRQFGDKVALEHSGPDGGPIQNEAYKVTEEDEEVIRRIREIRAGLHPESAATGEESPE